MRTAASPADSSPADTSTRARRRTAILAILRAEHVHSQAELAERLDERGLGANQATLSRDLRALGVAKGPSGYVLPGEGAPAAAVTDELSRACHDWLREAIAVAHQVVVKTPPGGAVPMALALDAHAKELVVGTVAGDDTVLAICPTPRDAKRLARLLNDRLPTERTP
ncbi:MAG: arginine repressor [Planctomycetes bacterium]|nr:arginine repressor [Planctomycetota bacterium]